MANKENQDQPQNQGQAGQQHFCMWLNNYVHKRHLGKITYYEEENRQQQTWTATVQLDGTDIGNGQARNKKGAHENAAREGLAFLQSQYGTAD